MCNACGFFCCAWDGMGKCGCNWCDNPACRDDKEEEDGDVTDLYDPGDEENFNP